MRSSSAAIAYFTHPRDSLNRTRYSSQCPTFPRPVNPKMTLNGKIFVVTGATSGIGRAIVNKLLGLSATVHAIDKADTIPDDSSSKVKLHIYSSVDVSSRQAVERVFNKIFSVQNGLVNCAGIARQHASTVEMITCSGRSGR